ncbi:MAG: thermonuclease family protein [Proteobacteria bacterium]|nr:thermonuclease family protein [Pseudomonadota bacterium]
MTTIRPFAAAAALALATALTAAGGAGAASPPKPAQKPMAGSVSGTVTAVLDGDTLTVTPDGGGKPIELRLAGIDAPEICQDGGADARAYLAELVLKQPVRAQIGNPHGEPAPPAAGRVLATLWKDDIEVNRRMVEEGQAWSVRIKYDRGPFVPQERMARALSRGVFKVGSAAVSPKDFRQRHGPCAEGAAAPPPPVSAPPAAKMPAKPETGGFRCDGRTRCSQMTSCAEATFFLKNCPGVQMDGNRDGVPCESQWCRR